jgi:predicted porin
MKGLRAAAASAAALMFSGMGGAYAADLGPYPVKAVPAAPPTCASIMDFFTTACQVSAYGIRFYGTLDMGFGYMTNGTPIDKVTAPVIDPIIGKNSHGARWNFAPDAWGSSAVGVQVKEALGGGWSFVGQLETQFNPLGIGHLVSAPGSVQENVGLSLNQQTAPGDGNGNGKFYNGLGFAGVSNDTWGTLTFGRQNTLLKDGLNAYDSTGGSLAFSYTGLFGGPGGGGDTENSKATTAIKYRVNFANWHFGAFTQVGGYDAGNASQAVGLGDAGADFKVGPGILSADFMGGVTKGGISEGLTGASLLPGIPDPNAPQHLTVTQSDNYALLEMTKYSLDKLTLYAGYEFINFANPGSPVSSFTDITGQFIQPGSFGLTSINTTAYTINKHQQVMWTGAKYAWSGSVDFMLDYAHIIQNDYSGGVSSAAAGGVSQNCAQNSRALSSCGGQMDAISFVVDYRIAPKWDVYAGTEYSTQTGGMANGFMATNNWSTNAGIRFRW